MESVLWPSTDRFVLFPIQHQNLWDLYKMGEASSWPAAEVDLSKDLADYAHLNGDERHFIEYVLAFFATADGIVNENLALRFYTEVQIPEARAFYSWQIANETVHQEMYSLLISTYVSDSARRFELFHAIENVPAIRRKAEWAMRHIESSASFAERLLAFACVEGILFSGSFCAIFWLKKRGLMPGLSLSNELISRDEGLHCRFACELYRMLDHPLAFEHAQSIVNEVVEIESEFITSALPVNLIGMNADLMGQYIRYVADYLLVAIGVPKLYGVTNPFDWMELISLQGKTNFFERRVGDYARANVISGRHALTFGENDDF